MGVRASFALRTAAWAIDLILLLALSLVVGMMAGSVFTLLAHQFHFSGLSHDPVGHLLTSGLLGVGIFILVTLLMMTLLSLPYNLMEAFFGWTPGKLATGLRVCNRDGSRASFGQVFSRWLIKHNGILLSLLSFVGIPALFLGTPLQALVVGGCFMALAKDCLALHDHMCGTAVYEASSLEATV